jgi:ribosomal-protein-alanine N-acetyltransferase
MGEAEAREVAGWHYDPPYTFYDWSQDGDDLALLLGAKSRKGRFFSVYDDDDALTGFFEFQVEDDVVVVGLGLRPDQTGRGLGVGFVEEGLEFAREKFKPTAFRLAVAAFNARAIRVYERAGFTRGRMYDHETNGGVFRFVEMERPA